MSAVQTLDISPVGRVEGDLDVRVDIEDGVVINAWTNAEMFRGFEVILRDKDPQAGLVVTPRACGICGLLTSHVPLGPSIPRGEQLCRAMLFWPVILDNWLNRFSHCHAIIMACS